MFVNNRRLVIKLLLLLPTDEIYYYLPVRFIITHRWDVNEDIGAGTIPELLIHNYKIHMLIYFSVFALLKFPIFEYRCGNHQLLYKTEWGYLSWGTVHPRVDNCKYIELNEVYLSEQGRTWTYNSQTTHFTRKLIFFFLIFLNDR